MLMGFTIRFLINLRFIIFSYKVIFLNAGNRKGDGKFLTTKFIFRLVFAMLIFWKNFCNMILFEQVF